MKIVLVNTAENMGGAAIATKRLMQALRSDGLDATMLVRDKTSNDPHVVALPGRRMGGQRLQAAESFCRGYGRFWYEHFAPNFGARG